jgi:YYY domain-containing protein
MFDWIAREGAWVLSWWALATAAGLAALPLCMRLMGGLPDRGYTLARPLGVLLVALLHWLLGIYGFTANTTAGMAVAWLFVLGLGVFALAAGERIDLRRFWRDNRAIIVSAELIFLGLFLFWAVVRAYQPGIVSTEKPMELAFMSASARSAAFPPNDPWMSGYAISYYYLGYILSAMFTMLSGLTTTIGFNLTIALLFALTGSTAFGVVANLVRAATAWRARHAADADPDRKRPVAPAVWTGLLGMLLLVLASNYQFPIIEVPYETGAASAEYLRFWDAEERNQPRFAPAADLYDWDYWWFFRAARVINDRDLNGVRSEVIDEFPAFSFLLADVHPHVLALPFTVLAAGLGLNALLDRGRPRGGQVVVYGAVVGGLIFLNTWDAPTYLAVIAGGEGLRRLLADGRGRPSGPLLLRTVGFAVAVGLVAVVVVLPFLLGFRSQLGGVLPNLIHPTRFNQFFVAFGPLLLLLIPYLVIEARRGGARFNAPLGLLFGLTIAVLLLVLLAFFIVLAALSEPVRAVVLNFVGASGGMEAVLPALLERRIAYSITAVVLIAGIVLVVARLLPRLHTPARAGDGTTSIDDAVEARSVITYTPATGFALLLIGLGIVMVLLPEFIYLRDNFGNRMNTVFKFYYQTWTLWSLAGAFAVYSILADHRWSARVRALAVGVRAGYALYAGLVIVLALPYIVLGVYYRTQIETGRWDAAPETARPISLDGAWTIAAADDLEAIQCLSRLVQGSAVVAERVGGSYDIGIPPTGLAGRLAGLQNVFNWAGHQQQWRGATYGTIAGTRESDLDALYADPTLRTTQIIVDRYRIDYIVFGTAERQKYGSEAEIKFRDVLPIVCQSGNTRIYSTDTLDAQFS